MRTRRVVVAAFAACLAACLSACAPKAPRAAPAPPSAPSSAPPTAATPGVIPPAKSSRTVFSHIAVIIMENKEYGDVIGNPSAPFVNSLARRSGLATSFYAETHPSLPNYLALLGGFTFGIRSDCTSCRVGGTNLVDQLGAAGLTWKAYMEGMPWPCFQGPADGLYAKKHDPFLYFDDIADDPARCRRVVPMAQLASDEASGALPDFIWITPDLCHDMHSCPVSTGDRFLASLVPGLLRAMGRGGLLFVTWDEGSSSLGCCGPPGGGHVATILAGKRVTPGRRLGAPFTHLSILRTIEGVWGLSPLRQAGCTCTESMGAFFAPA